VISAVAVLPGLVEARGERGENREEKKAGAGGRNAEADPVESRRRARDRFMGNKGEVTSTFVSEVAGYPRLEPDAARNTSLCARCSLSNSMTTVTGHAHNTPIAKASPYVSRAQ